MRTTPQDVKGCRGWMSIGEKPFGLGISRGLKGEQSLEVLTGRDMGNESHEVAADHSHRFSIKCRMNRSLVTHVELWILFVGRQIMPSAPISPHFFQHHHGCCTTSVHKISENLCQARFQNSGFALSCPGQLSVKFRRMIEITPLMQYSSMQR